MKIDLGDTCKIFLPRYQPPVPIGKHEGIKETKTNGHVCPQHMYYKPDIWIGTYVLKSSKRENCCNAFCKHVIYSLIFRVNC